MLIKRGCKHFEFKERNKKLVHKCKQCGTVIKKFTNTKNDCSKYSIPCLNCGSTVSIFDLLYREVELDNEKAIISRLIK